MSERSPRSLAALVPSPPQASWRSGTRSCCFGIERGRRPPLARLRRPDQDGAATCDTQTDRAGRGRSVASLLGSNPARQRPRSTFSGGGIGSTDGSLSVSQSTFLGSGVGFTNSSATVVRSTFVNGAGIKVQGGTFSIVGNVLANNGSDSVPVDTPAISVTAGPNPNNRLEFNSLTRNRARPGTGTAIHCNVSGFVARNNILSGNGTAANPEQVSGSCAHWYSIVRGGTFVGGIGNSMADPGFVNADANDLHLMPGSPALGAADPATVLTGDAELDIDGHKRAPPADMGAYELP